MKSCFIYSILFFNLISCSEKYNKICIVERQPDDIVCDRALTENEKKKLSIILELQNADFYIDNTNDLYYCPPSDYNEKFEVTIWDFTELMLDSVYYNKRISELMSNNNISQLPTIEDIREKRRR